MSGASPCPLCNTDVVRANFPGHLNRIHEGCDLVALNERLPPFDRIARCFSCPKMCRARYMAIHKCKGAGYNPNAVEDEDELESLCSEFEEDSEAGMRVLGAASCKSYAGTGGE